jgi:hypothetical protein
MQTAVESIRVDIDLECKSRGMIVNWDMYLAMEKEQIINASAYMLSGVMSEEAAQRNGEMYYNETYKP